MCTFTWFNFIIFLSGVFSDNFTTCVTPNLFDEFKDRFGKKDLNLKQIGDKYFKCLAMYVRDPQLVLNSTTMENIVRMDPGVDELAKYIIQQITDGDRLAHSDHFPAFMETCFYKSHLKTFGMLLGSFFRSNYKMKLTCPLGLLWDIICTFTSCLQSDCKVDGETCPSQQDSKESCRTSINLKLYCKSNFGSFLDSCVNDVNKYKDDLTKSLDDDLHDTDCSNFNYIYQGLTSLQVVEKSVIAADCHESEEGNVTMKCFRNGKYLQGATWNLDDTKDPRGSKGTLSISRGDLLRYSNISCYEDYVKLAEIVSKHTYQLCYSDKEESNVVNDIRNKRTRSPVSSTTTPPKHDTNRDKWKDFYRSDKIWLFGSYGSLDGIDAFDNMKRLQTNVDKLTVPLVSVEDRLTPICGELWNKGAADVFCRDAGAQLQQNWIASFVGAVHKSKNERHENNEFYKHYLRNIACKGNESNIIWCDHDGWYHHSACTHDAVVICSEVAKDEILIVLVTVIAGIFLVGVLSFFIIRKLYPKQCKSLRKKLLEACLNHQPPDPTRLEGKADTPDDTSRKTESTIVVMEQLSQSNSASGDMNNHRPASSLFGSSSLVIHNPEFEQENDLKKPGQLLRDDARTQEWVLKYEINNSIQEYEVLKRLNHMTAPQWAVLCKMEGETLVCKSYKNVDGETEDDTQRTEQFFLSRVKLNHPNVVKCVREPRVILFDNKRKHSFFMEYLEFGGLDSYLRNLDKHSGVNHGHLTTVEDATNVIIGACRALHYVHSLGYVHADISTDNFFTFRNRGPAPFTGLLDVKLGDFESFYRPASDDLDQSRKQPRFTPLYAAPEFIVNKEKNEIKKDAFKNDVWGLALVLWEVQSWITCKNNKSSFKSEDQLKSAALSSDMVSRSIRFVTSRIRYAHNYTCRRHVHVALLQKINNINPKAETRLPTLQLMEEFYNEIYPNTMGYPAMDPNLDKKFGWPITNLLHKCLAINPTNRLSMKQILEFLVQHANKEPLSMYKNVLESDLKLYRS